MGDESDADSMPPGSPVPPSRSKGPVQTSVQPVVCGTIMSIFTSQPSTKPGGPARVPARGMVLSNGERHVPVDPGAAPLSQDSTFIAMVNGLPTACYFYRLPDGELVGVVHQRPNAGKLSGIAPSAASKEQKYTGEKLPVAYIQWLASQSATTVQQVSASGCNSVCPKTQPSFVFLGNQEMAATFVEGAELTTVFPELLAVGVDKLVEFMISPEAVMPKAPRAPKAKTAAGAAEADGTVIVLPDGMTPCVALRIKPSSAAVAMFGYKHQVVPTSDGGARVVIPLVPEGADASAIDPAMTEVMSSTVITLDPSTANHEIYGIKVMPTSNGDQKVSIGGHTFQGIAEPVRIFRLPSDLAGVLQAMAGVHRTDVLAGHAESDGPSSDEEGGDDEEEEADSDSEEEAPSPPPAKTKAKKRKTDQEPPAAKRQKTAKKASAAAK